MPAQSPTRFRLNQTIQGKFFLTALTVILVFFILGGTAIYVAVVPRVETSRLMEDHLVIMNQAQKLIGNSVSIEHQLQTLLHGDSRESAQSYAKILELLDESDALVLDLGQTTSGPAILDMHHINQLFRNTIHIVANLHSGVSDKNNSSSQQEQKKQKLDAFAKLLDQQIKSMLITSGEFSSRINFDYRKSIEQARSTASGIRNWVVGVVISSLVITILTAYLFYQNTIARLRTISLQLRQQNQINPNESSSGKQQDRDEIDAMAKSLETLIAEK